jgi:DNA-binding IclR family transcriptional regulator
MGETTEIDHSKRTAAGRVLALLGAFSGGRGSFTLSEISRAAGLSLTTTHRLVKEVLDWGGLEVDCDGRYRLSLKILDLATSSTEALRLRERAMPYLVELRRRTDLTVHLAVRDGSDVVYLAALQLHPNYTGESRIGGRLPMHVSAAGLVLLAYAGEQCVEDFLRQPLKPYTPHTITDPDRLRQCLESIRKNRYMIAGRFISAGIGVVAAPVFSPDGSVESAVGVVYPVEEDPHRTLDLVRATANRISRSFLEKNASPDPRTIAFNRRRAGLI